MTDPKLKFDLSTMPFFVPVMTAKQFALGAGLTEDTVKAWLFKQKIPSRKIGKRRLVNVAALMANT